MPRATTSPSDEAQIESPSVPTPPRALVDDHRAEDRPHPQVGRVAAQGRVEGRRRRVDDRPDGHPSSPQLLGDRLALPDDVERHQPLHVPHGRTGPGRQLGRASRRRCRSSRRTASTGPDGSGGRGRGRRRRGSPRESRFGSAGPPESDLPPRLDVANACCGAPRVYRRRSRARAYLRSQTRWRLRAREAPGIRIGRCRLRELATDWRSGHLTPHAGAAVVRPRRTSHRTTVGTDASNPGGRRVRTDVDPAGI